MTVPCGVLADAPHLGNRRVHGDIQIGRATVYVGRPDLERLPCACDADGAGQFEQHRNDRFAPEAPRCHPEHALVEERWK